MEPRDKKDSVAPPRAGVATFVLVAAKGRVVADFGGEPIREDAHERTARFDLPSEAVEAAVAAVAANPASYAAVCSGELRETTLKAMIRQLKAVASRAQVGQVVVTLAAQDLARSALSAEFGFVSLDSVDLGGSRAERLFLVVHPNLPVREFIRRPEPGSAPRTSRANVRSRRITTFVGRRRELDELRGMLDVSRLVTVVGTTGIGKSALIRRMAEDVGSEFPDGVGEIDLSQLSQAALVAPTILRVLDAPKLGGEDHIDALVAHLKNRRMLLILDNAEHLTKEIRRIVIELLENCSDLQVVIGSQRPLRIAGEARYRLDGLETPAAMEDWRAMLEFDAVALFVDRAMLVDSRFRLTEENAGSVATLCGRLDAIPLAIEFAAAKTHILSPRQILARLDDRFLLLKAGDVDRPDRQRTLTSMIDWGYSLLRPDAQALLLRLSVFSGAFSVEIAAEFCADAGLSEEAVLGGFEELVEGSMLSPSSSRGLDRRFYLPETVRIYCRHKLRDSGEWSKYAERHRVWCERLCEGAAAGLQGAEQLVWLDRLDTNYEDVRTSIDGYLGLRGGAVRALRMLLSVHQYFFLRHYLIEGLRVTSKVVDAPRMPVGPDLARAMNLASLLAHHLGDSDAAREYSLRSIAMGRCLGDTSLVARARTTLGIVEEDCGRAQRAWRHFVYAASVFRSLGQEFFLLKLLINLAKVETTLGLLTESRAHLEEAEPLFKRHPDPALRGYFHQNYANLDLAYGAARSALLHSREALKILHSVQDLSAVATSLRNIAYALEALGRPQLAATFVGAARASARRMEQKIRPDEEARFQALTLRLSARLGVVNLQERTFAGADSTYEDWIGQISMVI